MWSIIFSLLWAALLALCGVVTWKDAKANRECRKELLKMNALLLEQNDKIKANNAELIKANQNLNTVIVRVCSKSVRDRKEQKRAEGNDEGNV